MKKTTVQEVQLLYCGGQAYSGDKERAKHVDYEHPAKLHYPTPEDLEPSIIPHFYALYDI